ncbi:MAG: RtcB family protein [Candidatus Binatia bacterium]|nr:RtcB family protein [Candidatus Binatia bacterium]
MPDAHAGYSLPIGAVVATEGVVVPAWVGFDIGCGMLAVQTSFDVEAVRSHGKAIFNRIYRDVPTGFSHNKRADPWVAGEALPRSAAVQAILNRKGMGDLHSLGGGNHFIELGADESGQVWIVIHSGSRNLGHSQALAGEVATRVALEAQLVSASHTVAEQHQAMADTRRDFGSELAKLRDALKITEERHEAAESRALLEIDRERTIAAKLQKELDLIRTSAAEGAARHRAELRTLQDEIGNHKKSLGNLEGELRAVNVSRDHLVIELTQERASVRELATKAAAAIRETETWQQQATDAQSELQALRAAQLRKVSKKAKEPGHR